MEINKVIEEIRVSKGFTRGELAKESGVSLSYVYQIERDGKNPTVKVASALLKAMGFTFEIVETEDEGE